MLPSSSRRKAQPITWLSRQRVRSPVDQGAMQRAFQTVVDRHAALRTVFTMVDDVPVQQVAGAADVFFVTLDAAGWDDTELHRQVETAQQQPFDLSRGPLLRVHLFTRAAADHVLLMTVHHIVFDGWSMGLVLDELALLYAAETGGPLANLAPVEREYGDFVAWQTEMLAGPEGEQLGAYWRKQLSGNLPVLDLPLDKPRPPIQQFRGSSISLQFGAELAQKLRALARTEHTTLYAVVLAAFYVLLHRHTGQEDLIVGSPMSGRGRSEFRKTVGYLVSPVPLRVRITAEQPFRSVLTQVRQTLHEAIAHEAYPFALLLEQLHPKRDPGRTPIMEVMFTQQKAQILGSLAEGMAIGGASSSDGDNALKLESYPLSQEDGQFDLSLLLIEAGDTLGGSLKYNTDLFEQPTIARMAGHLHTLLESIVAAPEQAVGALPMLSAAERDRLLEAWNDTAVAFPHEQLPARADRGAGGTHSRRSGGRRSRTGASATASSTTARTSWPGTCALWASVLTCW